MLLKLDIREESAVRLFSERLMDAKGAISVEIGDVDVQGIVALLINHSIAQRMAAMQHNVANP